MKPTLLLLAFATAAFAADAPKPQIIIEARFTETEVKTGKTDMLSSPRVTSREGQETRIDIIRETQLALSGSALAGARLNFTTGTSLDMTGWIEGERIILRGTATMRELDGEAKADADGHWAHLLVDEVPFVLRLDPGKPRDLVLPSSWNPGRKLTIQLTAKKHVPVNASAIYWRAFAALPKLDDAGRKLLDAKAGDPGDAARALAAKADAALKLLAEASGADFCDWSLDLTKGPALQLPHLAPMRDLAKLALLRARLREAGGDQAGALDDRIAVVRLAHFASGPALLVSRLVGIAIETPALEALATQLPMLDEAQRSRIASGIGFLERAPTMAQCVAAEAESMSAWMRSELDAQIKTQGEKFDSGLWVGQLINKMSSDTKLVADGERLRFRTADEARKLIDGYRIGMLELAKLIELPHSEFQPAAEKFYARIKAQPPENLLLSIAAPWIRKVRVKELQASTRLALLRAALEVQAKGESALPAELATHRKTGHGFELTSKAQFEGKPVVLTVGR